MSAAHDKTKLYASNPAEGACSDEPCKGPFSQAPLPGLSQKGGLRQKPLDSKEIMREKSST